MKAPEVNISFVEKGATAVARGERGTVALVLKDDAGLKGVYTVYSISSVPEGLSEVNRKYIKDVLKGYQAAPRKVIVYVMGSEDESGYTDMMRYFENTRFNWMAVPEAEKDGKTQEIAGWIKSMRTTDQRMVKAVLPNTSADCEGIVNVTSSLFDGDGNEIPPDAACPRIAGLIAGTPMTISCTYAPLTDYADCSRMDRGELDEAVDRGEFVFLWDGEKVKVCRGVNSFVTVTGTKGESFKKIKAVEIMDMIHEDIRITAQDSYIGKYANSYDNKCLLVTAVNAYFAGLVRDGLLESGSCRISVEAQRLYLQSQGENVEEMSDDEIRRANTGSHVFLEAGISILDAMEDIELEISI